MTHKTKLSAISAVALLTALTAPTAASAQDAEFSAGIDYVTEYVFRGVSLADQAFQPYGEVSVGNFTAGVWASLSEGDGTDVAGDEVDLYASYSFAVSDSVSLDAGITYYHYPQGGGLFETDGGGAGTYEVSLAAGFDTTLSPSLAAYYDLTIEAFTVEGGVSHSVPMTDMFSLDLGATAGLVDGDGFSYEYASASASLSYALTESTSAYVGGNLVASSEDSLNFDRLLAGGGKSEMVWFGVGLSTGF